MSSRYTWHSVAAQVHVAGMQHASCMLQAKHFGMVQPDNTTDQLYKEDAYNG